MKTAEFAQACRDYDRIEKAVTYIEKNFDRQPDLKEISRHIGLSEFHFQRLFSSWVGISPKRFLQFLTKEHVKHLLEASSNLLDAAYDAGLSGPGRLHDLMISVHALTPGEVRRRGEGVTIRYGLHASPFGKCLVAVTERGICRLSFIQRETSEGDAIDELAADWRNARMIEDHRSTAPLVEPVFDANARGRLNIHLRGTNFQLKVWEALLAIPAGAVTTYEGIAERIGRPTASRAVGTAVGHNPIAVLIPCHRVIRKTGEFGNYRYGTLRKKALLAREHVTASGAPHHEAVLSYEEIASLRSQ